jgi:hypothetical protein
MGFIWRPDTCRPPGCILEYAGQNTPEKIINEIRLCPIHANHQEAFDDNVKHTRALGAVAAALPGLVFTSAEARASNEAKLAAYNVPDLGDFTDDQLIEILNGESLRPAVEGTFKPGCKPVASYTEARVLEITARVATRDRSSVEAELAKIDPTIRLK